MRILHIVAGLPPGGGLAESVPTVCRHLQQLGHEVTLATLDGPMSEATLSSEAASVRLVRLAPSFPRTLYFSWQMLRGLPRLVRAADVVHVHSNWTFCVWWACRCALRAHRPLVMSPRGCLAPERMRRSAFKKRLAGTLFDARFLSAASVVHVTCEAEGHEVEEYLRARRCRTPPVCVIPNGVDAGTLRVQQDRVALERLCPQCSGKRVALFLGRLDSIKGLDSLVEAWKRAGAACTGWHLLIAGPSERGYDAHLRREVMRLGQEAHVTLVGPAYGDDKRLLLNGCDLFVLPSRNENFGNAVAEALACGVPVITTKGAPWAEVENCGNALMQECVNEGEENKAIRQSGNKVISPVRAGWWVEIGVEPLAEALREAMSLTDEERRAMGQNGRHLVETKYRWETVAAKMAEVYERCRSEKCVNAGKNGGNALMPECLNNGGRDGEV